MQRSQTREPRVSDRFEQAPPADPAPDPATACQEADRASQLAKWIDQLAPGQQEVLRLRLDAGLSYREIAAATGRSVGSVSSQLHDAIRQLRRASLQA
jgi:RNA polymerase sigma-70 factor (ECF subfamily)